MPTFALNYWGAALPAEGRRCYDGCPDFHPFAALPPTARFRSTLIRAGCNAVLAAGVLMAQAQAQTASSSSAPATATPAAPPAKPSAMLAKPPAGPSKACRAARTKVAREQQTLDSAKAELATTTKARAACASKSACARADDRIASLERRIPRHEARVAGYRDKEAEACPTG